MDACCGPSPLRPPSSGLGADAATPVAMPVPAQTCTETSGTDLPPPQERVPKAGDVLPNGHCVPGAKAQLQVSVGTGQEGKYASIN